MNKEKIKALCAQIAAATEHIISVGSDAAAVNGPQLLGIRHAARQIAAEVETQENEVAVDG